MRVTPLDLDGLRLIELKVWGDARGFFVERYRTDAFDAHGLPTTFVQDNHSRSAPGVLRGLHYQQSPWQRKLVGVVRGRIWDVVVDIRPDSPTFGRHVGLELSDTNGRLLWIPEGFAHGFCVLGDEPADILYKVDVPYNPATEDGIRWSDPDLAIRWPIGQPTVSERDRRLASFGEFRAALPDVVPSSTATTDIGTKGEK
ncbi:MAG: dTDP-4-dehydrorhamnose 3,5-epimerase [Acidobacteria bacterium]|nr:dTDP-4-dehydrorhamnose 3,5-epimerase [Acidobacteriota bacterium]